MYKIFAFRYDESNRDLCSETIAFMLDPGEDDIQVEIDEDGSLYGFDVTWGTSLEEARYTVEQSQHRAGAMYEINGNVEYEDLDEGLPELDESDIVYLGSLKDISDGTWIVVSAPQILRERAGAIGSDHLDRVALLDSSIVTTIPGDVDLEEFMILQPYSVISDDDGYAFDMAPQSEFLERLAHSLDAESDGGCELTGIDFCAVLWAWYRHHSERSRLPDWKTAEGVKKIVDELHAEDVETSLF